MNEKIAVVGDMVEACGGNQAVSDIMGVPEGTVRKWRHFNRVGPRHYLAFVGMCNRLGVRVDASVVLGNGNE